MNGEERSFSKYVNDPVRQGDVGRFRLNEHHIGILASLAIHAAFIFMFVIQPAVKMIPIKTFHISFDQGASSFLQSNSGSSAVAPVHNCIERHNPTAQTNPVKHRAMPEHAAAVHHAASDQKTPKERIMHPADEKNGSAKTTERQLPPVIGEVNGDEFTAAEAVPASGTARNSDAMHANSVNSVGISGAGGGASRGAFGDGSGRGFEDGFGNGSGGHASVGAGSGEPIEMRFGETNAPSFISREMPVYPPIARRRGIEGRVVLTLLIDQTGKVQKIDVTESAGYGLTEAAVAAVKKSTFAPGCVNGQKVAARAVLPIRFKLE